MKRPLLLADVEHVVVPAVLADQAREALGGGRRLGRRYAAQIPPAERDRVGAGHQGWPVGQSVVDDQGLTLIPAAGARPRGCPRQRRQPELARARDHVDDGFSQGVTSFQPRARSGGTGSRDRQCRQRLSLAGGQHQPERDVGNVLDGGVGAVLGREDDHPELVVGQGRELGDVAVAHAAMADALATLELRQRKAEPVCRRAPPCPELGHQHRPERLGPDDRTRGTTAVGEQDAQEPAQVGGRRDEVRRRPDAQRERRSGDRLAVVGPHHSLGLRHAAARGRGRSSSASGPAPVDRSGSARARRRRARPAPARPRRRRP